MRILILGATGAVGILLIRRALKFLESCEVVLYVRSSEKIPHDLRSNPSVTVIQGQLTDQQSLTRAFDDVHIVLSALGPSVAKGPFHPTNTPLAKTYLSIIDIMHQKGIKRLICLGTASIKDPADRFSLAFSILVNGVAIGARTAYNDMVAIGENVRAHGGDLEWTIVRVPLLTNQESEDVIAGYVGDGRTNTWLSRAGYAAFVIDEIGKRNWVKKAPLICSK
ncbi:hypothetical protein C0993_000524 [Termitomyces sp. T159_Od127]|nr:hypothetical protein C0993_000524 [Termitomyces sp. T159_Od127]